MGRKQTTVWLAAAMCAAVALAPGLAEAGVVTIQPPSQDTWAYPWEADRNLGNHQELNVLEDAGVWQMQSFVQFDVSAIPPAQDVEHAELRLYNHQTTWAGRADCTVAVFSITEPWIEGNGGTDDDPPGELVWNNKPANGPSALDEILFHGDGTGSGASTSITPQEWRSWDVTEAVAAWHEGTAPNYGLLLTKGATGGDLHVHFRSKDYSGGEFAPMLVVTYVPEPASLSLLGLGALGLLRRRRSQGR